MTRTPRAIQSIRARTGNLRTRIPASLSRKTVTYAGAGLALAGAGAATLSASLPGQAASVAGPQHKISRSVKTAAGMNIGRPAASATQATHGTPGTSKAPATSKAAAKQTTPARGNTPAKPTAPAKPTTPAKGNTPAKPTAPAKPAAPAKHAAAHHVQTWAAVSKVVAGRTYPRAGHGALPAQDQLTPVGTSGPQTWMPITPARWDNAKTIVKQAIAKHMGLRAAVIAVATSMQESTLLNLNYGDRDSLGLFQQRPSCGWGTPTQIQHPAYAADAFLGALHGYQVRNPDWAHQPLWQAAQGVQGSAFPSAYAKWEAQAAHLVAAVTPRIV